MQRAKHVWIIWFAFTFLNLIIRWVMELELGINAAALPSLRQGLWICIGLNTMYLAIFAHPWSNYRGWLSKGAPFFFLGTSSFELVGDLGLLSNGRPSASPFRPGFCGHCFGAFDFCKMGLAFYLAPAIAAGQIAFFERSKPLLCIH